jgi:hypothetical protein
MLYTLTSEAVMLIAAKLDALGLPAWIAVMILGFIAWWPLGLTILAFLIWSRRMGCGMHRGYGRWEHKMSRLQEKMERMRGRMEGRAAPESWWGHSNSSGNRAFDEYKTETLKRLEDEQREFHAFLDRLRLSKYRVEFDQFMAERRSRPVTPAQEQDQP